MRKLRMNVAEALLRQADRRDVREIQRVRHSVRENVLTSCVITDDEVVDYLENRGRGWVVEEEGRIVGFSIGDATDGNIWALFVEPEHEGRGHGRRLHDAMVAWLFETGLERLYLGTEPATRAERFYERAGWKRLGLEPNGEMAFELTKK